MTTLARVKQALDQVNEVAFPIAVWLALTAALALVLNACAVDEPEPPPLPVDMRDQSDRKARAECTDFARRRYPGIEWRYIVGIESEPFQLEGVDGTKVVILGSRGRDDFRIACFAAPGAELRHWLFSVHPVTGEATEIKL